MFPQIWQKYFLKRPATYKFGFIEPLQFFKNSRFDIYKNIGKNITNGNIYCIDNSVKDFKGISLLIYDVPSYLQDQKCIETSSHLCRKIIPQYKGYLSELEGFSSLDEFMQFKFSAKSRNNIRKWRKKLYNNFEIDFKAYTNDITEKQYNEIFDSLLNLIEKRWGELGMRNDIIVHKAYYRELGYRMINEGSAAFYVLKSNGEPIAISLSFLSDEELYFAITTFDTDYRRYNLGHMLIMHMVEWCIENNIKVFDYSKGTYDYKIRWATKEYLFENHILYDKNSCYSNVLSIVYYCVFKLKQFLREKNINLLLSKIRFVLKNEKKRNKHFVIKDLEKDDFSKLNSELVSAQSNDYLRFKSVIYDTVFTKPQCAKNVELYKLLGEKNSYVIRGDKFLKYIELD